MLQNSFDSSLFITHPRVPLHLRFLIYDSLESIMSLMWLIYLAHLSEARLMNSQPCRSECTSSFFPFLVSVFYRRWSDAERPCRLDGGPVRLACLCRTFINRGEWNVIPGLVSCIQPAWLLQSFVCVFPFPALWVSPSTGAFETQAHPHL